MQTAILVILSIAANALANVFLKIGADRLPVLNMASGASYLKVFTSPWILLGALLFITNFPIYNMLLQRMKLSVAFPLVTTCAFAGAIIVSAVFLKEKLILPQYLGLGLLVISLWLISGRNI